MERVLAGLVLLCLVQGKKTVIEKSEGIFILTEKNYDVAVKEFDNMLVYFYAPWCGHCKALGPEFVKAGQLLKERDSTVKLGKVDGTEEESLMDRQGVTGYPTLKLYREGKLVPYTGGRMAPEMVSWLDKKLGPPALPLVSLQEVQTFTKDHEVAVVGFFTVGSPEYESYTAACRDYDDYGVHYPVAVTSDPGAAEHYGTKDKVVIFKKFDEPQVVYEGDLGVQEIRDFITENSLPTVIEFNHENAQKMFKTPNDGKSHLLVFHNRSSPTFDEEKKMMAKVGKEFRPTVLFTSVDVGEEDHRRMVEFLGVRHRINNDTYPSMRIVTMTGSSAPVRYRPQDTTVTEDNLRDFVTRYIAGAIPREYYTEPLPADWDSKPAKYITAANFKSLVLEDKSHSSLVMWYAPWCGHCKNIMKAWDELGEKFPSLLVAKIDATVNEVPGLPAVHSFPTIKLYRPDGTEAEYNGERTVSGLSKFVTTDGQYGLAAPDQGDEPQVPRDEL